jgi:3-oxoacyl-[acyl-carrier-protein] synthase III
LLYLHAIGHFHPANVIDNSFLQSLDIGVDVNWVEERVGINERRTTMTLDYIRHTKNRDPRAAAEGSSITTMEMARGAAELALSRAGLAPAGVQMVIAGGCTPQMLIPAEASRVAAALGIGVTAMDVQAGCASFATQLHVLSQMRPESLPDFVLVVNVEAFTRTINYADRATAVLFGDGASAAILSPRIPASSQIMTTLFNSDPAGHEQIIIPAGGHFAQDGHAVQMFAIRKTVELFQQLQTCQEASPGAKQYFVAHQANLRMLETVSRRAGLPEDCHLTNVARFGNCGAAGAPSVLSQNWEQLETCAINMAVVGSGLAWGGIRITKGLESREPVGS